jgi:hypothetical protein
MLLGRGVHDAYEAAGHARTQRRRRDNILTCLLARNPSVRANARPVTRPACALALRFTRPLSALEIGALVVLGWLREGTEINREHVGEAAAVRDMASRLRG